MIMRISADVGITIHINKDNLPLNNKNTTKFLDQKKNTHFLTTFRFILTFVKSQNYVQETDMDKNNKFKHLSVPIGKK